MRYVSRLVVAIACCLLLVACNSQTEHVNLNKRGTEYIIDNVRFIYPDRYELDGISWDTKRIQFQSDDEYIFYHVYEDETDNELTHRDELYVADLQQESASNVVVSQPILDTGLIVYEITGSYIDKDMRFKHIVYFTENYTYIYGYMATIEDYEENIREMTVFLQSIVVEEARE